MHEWQWEICNLPSYPCTEISLSSHMFIRWWEKRHLSLYAYTYECFQLTSILKIKNYKNWERPRVREMKWQQIPSRASRALSRWNYLLPNSWPSQICLIVSPLSHFGCQEDETDSTVTWVSLKRPRVVEGKKEEPWGAPEDPSSTQLSRAQNCT